MSSAIGFREFSEDDYRTFIRALCDDELIKAGKRLRILCGDVVTPTAGTFDRQLKICREEYRRRHPKGFLSFLSAVRYGRRVRCPEEIMRIIAPFMVAGILLFASSSQAQTNDEKELRRIEAETARLEQQNDTALVKFIADDWVCVNPARGSISKSEFIQNMKHNLDTHENGTNSYTIEKKNVLVRVFGDTAVVTYTKEYRQTPDTSKYF